MVLYPNKLPESERVCSGICTFFIYFYLSLFCCRATCRGLNFSAKVIASPSRVNAGIQPQVKRKNLPLRW